MQTTLKLLPSVRTQIAEYCADEKIPATLLVVLALSAMGVQIEEQDLKPAHKGGRRFTPTPEGPDDKRIMLPIQIRKYIRYRAAQKLLEMPDVSFTGLIMLGLRKMGFEIPEAQISQENRWQVR